MKPEVHSYFTESCDIEKILFSEWLTEPRLRNSDRVYYLVNTVTTFSRAVTVWLLGNCTKSSFLILEEVIKKIGMIL